MDGLGVCFSVYILIVIPRMGHTWVEDGWVDGLWSIRLPCTAYILHTHTLTAPTSTVAVLLGCFGVVGLVSAFAYGYLVALDAFVCLCCRRIYGIHETVGDLAHATTALGAWFV
jgi:hypothetical protein